MLEFLAFHVYSCLYGTFLVNGDKERCFEGIKLHTGSLWTEILQAVQLERRGDAPLAFVNPTFDAVAAWEYISKQKSHGIQLLPLSCSSKRIVFWEDHYLKFDSDNLSLPGFQREAVKQPVALSSPELAEYLKALEDQAAKQRQEEIPYLSELLTRLQVQLQPPPVTTLQGTSVSQPAVTHDTKSCWQCHEKFGFFSTRETCSRCAIKAPLCSKCVRVVNGKKLCTRCKDMTEAESEIFDDE